MKTICLIVQGPYDFDPRVRRKAEALASAGYSVDVLALRLPDGLKVYTLDGVNVRTVALGKKRGSLARYAFEYAAFFLWAFWRVHMQMRRRRYAVVDVNTLPDFLIFAPLFVRRMGAKLVLDMHEITPEFYRSKYGIPECSWIIRLLKAVERYSFDFADRVITINEPVEDLLVSRALPRGKSTVVMNAADEARFAAGSRLQSRPAAVPGRFVIVYHGTLTRIYGLDIAIEAFSRVHEQMPGAELWILGSGTEQARLKADADRLGVSEKVRLVGQVPPEEIPGWLAECDAGILPMRRDALLDFAFPNKLPEYIVSGKPVIVSRLAAIRHYFSESALAYATPEDPEDLAAQMVRLYHDAELRRSLAAQAAAEYERIRWHVMKGRYLTLVNSLCAPERRLASTFASVHSNPEAVQAAGATHHQKGSTHGRLRA